MIVYRYNDTECVLKTFASAKAAGSKGNEPFFKAEDLVTRQDLSSSDLANIHNAVSEKKVTRFSDRAAAERRTLEVLKEAEAKMPAAPEGEKETAEPKEGKPPRAPKEPKAPKEKKEGTGKRGRIPGQNAWVGKTLHAKTDKNDRRAGSIGYRSLQIIIDNPGITTEEFLKKGGRTGDLRWDVDRKRVEVKNKE